MPRWKGKKVTNKRLYDLKSNAEFRRVCERSKYGFNYKITPIIIGGNKNSKINYIKVY
jgi:hypothetical protein